MPKIIKTKGICLLSRPVRETSKLTIFYTEQFGKLTFIAKGARKPNSRFGSALEPFDLSELIFYKMECKSAYTLSDACLIDELTSLKLTDKFFYANQIVELVLRAVNFEDPNQRLYTLLYSALKNLDSAVFPANYSSLIAAYFLKALSILGYQPEVNRCVICRNHKVSYFSIERGGTICLTHYVNDNTAYGKEHIKPLKYLLSASLEKTLKTSIPIQTLKLVEDYLFYHLEKITLHSLRVAKTTSK